MPADGTIAAMMGSSARPAGSLGKMLHQTREGAEGGILRIPTLVENGALAPAPRNATHATARPARHHETASRILLQTTVWISCASVACNRRCLAS
jgi:hypothetical protein